MRCTYHRLERFHVKGALYLSQTGEVSCKGCVVLSQTGEVSCKGCTDWRGFMYRVRCTYHRLERFHVKGALYYHRLERFHVKGALCLSQTGEVSCTGCVVLITDWRGFM